MANCLFLGGLGIFTYGITDHLVIAYMIPVFYYICCYGAGQKYLGKFYLFSLMTGDLENKIWLGTAGILLTAAGIVIRNRKK